MKLSLQSLPLDAMKSDKYRLQRYYNRLLTVPLLSSIDYNDLLFPFYGLTFYANDQKQSRHSGSPDHNHR